MILNKIIETSNTNIIILWVFLYLIIVFVSYLQKIKKETYTKAKNKASPLFLKYYLDQFYVTNIYFTFFATFLLIFGITIIFILLRFIQIDSVVILSTLGTENFQLVFLKPLIIAYIKLFITLILYRSLLYTLFSNQRNKFYLFIKQFSFMSKIRNFLDFQIGHYIIGHLYLVTYRISTFTFEEGLYPSFENDLKYAMDNEYDYVLEKKLLIKGAYKVMALARKYYIIQYFFKILARFFRFILKHITFLNKPLPHLILILIFLFELYYKNFHYIYMFLFSFMLIKTKRDLHTFFMTRDFVFDLDISRYFYKNEIDYKIQRLSFYKTDKLILGKEYNTFANRALFNKHSLQKLIDYTLNNFEDIQEKTADDYNKEGLYRRILCIIGFITMGYFLIIKNNTLIYNNETIIIIISPILLLCYCNFQSYKRITFDQVHENEDFIYNRKYTIMFWIITIFQTYLFWLIISKPALVLSDTTLIEIPFNLLEIKKTYSIEEKIMFLFHYFEKISFILQTENISIDIDYLRAILRQIDFQTLINNDTNIITLKYYVMGIFDNYFILNQHYYNLFFKIIESFPIKKHNYFLNIFIIIYACKIIYLNYIDITQFPKSYLLIKKIILDLFYKKMTVDYFETLLAKIF